MADQYQWQGVLGRWQAQWTGQFANFRGHCMGQWQGRWKDKWQGQLANVNPYRFLSLDCQWQPMADQWPDQGQVQLLGQFQGQWNPRISRATVMANGKANVSSSGNGRSNGEAISIITGKIYSYLFLTKPLLLLGLFHVFHALSRPPPSCCLSTLGAPCDPGSRCPL